MEKAATIDCIDGKVWTVAGFREAKYLREKRARNRLARGSDSEVRILRRKAMVGSRASERSIAEATILPVYFSRSLKDS